MRLDRVQFCRSVCVALLWTVLIAADSSGQAYTHIFNIPTLCSTTDPAKPGVSVYVPTGLQHIRGIVTVMNNADIIQFSQFPEMRQVANNRQLAIVYFRCTGLINDVKDGNGNFQSVLDKIAEVTKIPDFKYAPFMGIGQSSTGEWGACLVFRYPDRAPGGLVHCGAVPQYPEPSYAKGLEQTIVYSCAVGQVEWVDAKLAPFGHWYQWVRPGMLYYRKKGWLTTALVGPLVDHANYEASPVTKTMSYSFLSKVVDRTFRLRVPTDVYPTTGPVTLKPIDPTTGYLLSPGIGELFSNDKYRTAPKTTAPDTFIHRYADVSPEKRDSMFWVFDLEMARAWVLPYCAR